MARRMLVAGGALATLRSAAGVVLKVRDEDPCACRNWMDTYATTGVKCGMTNEYYFATRQHALPEYSLGDFNGLKDEFCLRFFEAINDDYCINVNMGVDRGQWCFVDAACPSLAGGDKVNGQVSWKMCSPEKDRMLRQYDPPALAKLATEQHLELGLMNKMSYPLSGYKWKYVSGFWGATLDELTSVQDVLPGATVDQVKDFLRPRWGKRDRDIDDEMKKDLLSIFNSGVPTTFDTAKDNHPPHVIVHGKTVYVVIPNYKPSLLCVFGCQH